MLLSRSARWWIEVCPNKCSSRLDTFEKIVESVVSLGYERQDVKVMLIRLLEKGLSVDSVDSAVNSVVNEMKKDLDAAVPIEVKKTPYEKVELERENVLKRLRAVVVIPSIVDVCNGLRKWFEISPENEVKLIKCTLIDRNCWYSIRTYSDYCSQTLFLVL